MPMPDIRDQVDRLLSAPKELAGATVWHLGPRTGQVKWKAPLLLTGEVLNMDLIAIAYPHMPMLTFTLLVTFEDVPVSRLDYSESEEHNNGLIVPPNVDRWKITGPHLHRWQDNRGLATHATLPEELEYAVPIPSPARGFPNAFRWFCGEHKITLTDIPEYPGSELLL